MYTYSWYSSTGEWKKLTTHLLKEGMGSEREATLVFPFAWLLLYMVIIIHRMHGYYYTPIRNKNLLESTSVRHSLAVPFPTAPATADHDLGQRNGAPCP